MKREIRVGPWLFEIRVRRIQGGRFEVQDTNERGYMVWFSDAPYLSRREAIRVAQEHPLPAGWNRKVRHVGNGSVVFRRP